MPLRYYHRLTTFGAALVLGCGLALPAAADDVLLETNISLKMAQKAAEEALKQCERDGFRVSVAVVDRAGVVKALLRDDDAGPHTPDSSFRKAYTAASLRRSTGELAELVVAVPTAEGLRDMNDNILILAGGLPIAIGGEVIGGIGVGGAPGGQFDEACAQAGIDKITNDD